MNDRYFYLDMIQPCNPNSSAMFDLNPFLFILISVNVTDAYFSNNN